MCNWYWRYGKPKQLEKFHIWAKLCDQTAIRFVPLEVQKPVVAYLIGEEFTAEWFSGAADAYLKQRKVELIIELWRPVLLGAAQVFCLRGSRLADSDDESDSGVWRADLDYTNKLWKLQLARPSRYGADTDGMGSVDAEGLPVSSWSGPLHRVIAFLGSPKQLHITLSGSLATRRPAAERAFATTESGGLRSEFI